MYPTDEDYRIAEQNGISKRNVYQRVFRYDYDVKRAITEPLNLPMSEWQVWKEVAKQTGVSNSLYNARLKKGMTPEQAASTPITPRGWNMKMKAQLKGGITYDV